MFIPLVPFGQLTVETSLTSKSGVGRDRDLYGQQRSIPDEALVICGVTPSLSYARSSMLEFLINGKVRPISILLPKAHSLVVWQSTEAHYRCSCRYLCTRHFT